MVWRCPRLSFCGPLASPLSLYLSALSTCQLPSLLSTVRIRQAQTQPTTRACLLVMSWKLTKSALASPQPTPDDGRRRISSFTLSCPTTSVSRLTDAAALTDDPIELKETHLAPLANNPFSRSSSTSTIVPEPAPKPPNSPLASSTAINDPQGIGTVSHLLSPVGHIS